MIYLNVIFKKGLNFCPHWQNFRPILAKKSCRDLATCTTGRSTRGAFCRSMNHYFNVPNINTATAPYFNQEKLVFIA
jgi:hypothetical protein